MSDKKTPFYKRREGWKSHSPHLPPAEPPPPPCTRCGHAVNISRIEPGEPGLDLRTYECVRCQNVDQYIVQYQTTDAWQLVSGRGTE